MPKDSRPLMMRMPAELHKKVREYAAADDVTWAAWCLRAVRQRVHRRVKKAQELAKAQAEATRPVAPKPKKELPHWIIPDEER